MRDGRWFIDLHCHTSASFDSLADPARVVAAAASRGLTHLVVTDHDRIEGALRALRLPSSPGLVRAGSGAELALGVLSGAERAAALERADGWEPHPAEARVSVQPDAAREVAAHVIRLVHDEVQLVPAIGEGRKPAPGVNAVRVRQNRDPQRS